MKSRSERGLSRRLAALALSLTLAACSDPAAGVDAVSGRDLGFGPDANGIATVVTPVAVAPDLGAGDAAGDPDDLSDLGDADDPPADPDADAQPEDPDASDVFDAPDSDLCAPHAPVPTDIPYVRAGTGATTFVAVDNCAEVPLLVGFQGSGHIWGALEVGGFVADEESAFNLDFTFTQEGELVAEARFVDALRRAGEPAEDPYYYTGVTVVVDLAFTLESRIGIPGVLRVRVRGGDGLDLSDEVVLVPSELVE